MAWHAGQGAGDGMAQSAEEQESHDVAWRVELS